MFSSHQHRFYLGAENRDAAGDFYETLTACRAPLRGAQRNTRCQVSASLPYSNTDLRASCLLLVESSRLTGRDYLGHVLPLLGWRPGFLTDAKSVFLSQKLVPESMARGVYINMRVSYFRDMHTPVQMAASRLALALP